MQIATQTQAERREFLKFNARALLSEARNRRHSPANKDFYWTLLQWAANARREAFSINVAPAQGELFSF